MLLEHPDLGPLVCPENPSLAWRPRPLCDAAAEGRLEDLRRGKPIRGYVQLGFGHRCFGFQVRAKLIETMQSWIGEHFYFLLQTKTRCFLQEGGDLQEALVLSAASNQLACLVRLIEARKRAQREAVLAVLRCTTMYYVPFFVIPNVPGRLAGWHKSPDECPLERLSGRLAPMLRKPSRNASGGAVHRESKAKLGKWI